MRRFNPEKELSKIRNGNKKKVIISICALLVVGVLGYSFALYQVRYNKRITYTEVEPFSNKDLNLAVYVDGVRQNEFPKKEDNITFIDLVCDNGIVISSWDNEMWGLKISNTILLPNKCNTYFTSGESIIKEFTYSGHEEEYEIPKDGLYKIELWGAGGGMPATVPGLNGLGGYTSGIIILTKGEKLYFYVGEKGKDGIIGANKLSGTSFNGGGSGIGSTDDNDGGGSGGGATDVRLEKGTTWDDFESLKSRIMVAGGGSGGPTITTEIRNSSGGGLTGVGDSWYWQSNSSGSIFNATQISGYKFGIGENGAADMAGGSGGGGGYYGGLADHINGHHGGGGGGSSFISGHQGCNAIDDEQSTSIDKIVHTNQSNHYSGKVFTNTVMIDGLGYYWTDIRQAYIGMPTFNGKGTMEGNDNNGYAKITYLGTA